MKFSIISYNINGIRAALKKGLYDWLKNENYDILCFQETKAQQNQIEKSLFESLGYKFQFWHSAEKKGYSGVGLVSKIEPENVDVGLKIEKYDLEGRLIRADFRHFTLLSVYIPSGTTGDERQAFKMNFLHDFFNYTNELKNKKTLLLISGDFNICHKPIDINHPERHKKSSGFLPEEREWFDGFIDNGFVDTFRMFNKNPNQYSWWSYRAGSREKNLGWRIDYHIASEMLKNKVKNADILNHVNHSDHCPVLVEIEV
ncbi:exodeoxyribonuclease III [Bacteroidota bacterium]